MQDHCNEGLLSDLSFMKSAEEFRNRGSQRKSFGLETQCLTATEHLSSGDVRLMNSPTSC